MRQVVVAATQFACSDQRESNWEIAEALVRDAAGQGANIVLLQELFEGPYFCKEQDAAHFGLARPFAGNVAITRLSRLAAQLNVVLPVSFFEKANNSYFNSLAMIDATGEVMGVYRKSHIPDGPGYQEKFYFTPGDTGFRVWHTQFGAVGAGICWDQWFPESARCMALMGAEILFYPTAIGSEPHDSTISSEGHWRRTMQGHAAANMVPLIASNRIGTEQGKTCSVSFYGGSFITDETGDLVAQAQTSQAVLTGCFDLDQLAIKRAAWGLYRDRRPELYLPVLSLDGSE